MKLKKKIYIYILKYGKKSEFLSVDFSPIGVFPEISPGDFGDFVIHGVENPIMFNHYQKKHEIEICASAVDSDYEENGEISLVLLPNGEGLDDQIGLPNVLIISSEKRK